jgi:hypothetical protein
LFDEARALVDDKNYAKACPKFAESERLDPGGGTILNLALCHEAEGKTASAWTDFNEALSRAIRDGRPEREARARERIAVLQPKLSRLTVIVPDGAPADLDLTVDSVPWGAVMRGAAVPLDPGPHLVVAKVRDASPWSITVTLGANADAKTVVVPPLGSAAAIPPPTPPTPALVDRTSDATPHTSHTAGWIFAVAGVAASGVGTYFGLRALAKRSDSDAYCQPGCTQHGVDLNDQAITAAWISDVAIGLGVASVATGVYLLLTSHDDARQRPTTSNVRVVPRAGGAALVVSW